MDVSSDLEKTSACDLCGYPRRGLSPDALCPECGEPPSQPGTTANTPARTKEELTWLRTVSIGLWLLIIASIGALQVVLVMPAREMSLGAVNFPGPKVHAAAMIQRSIGGQPGPWGVAGTFWAMATVLAVWFITERRALRGDRENIFSLRRTTRWTAVLTVGGMAGLLLSGANTYIPAHSHLSFDFYSYAVGCCELPSNVLLYLYLRNLAQRMGDRRSTAILNVCAWAVPAVIGTALALLVSTAALNATMMGITSRNGRSSELAHLAALYATQRIWRGLSVLYGSAALAAGVAAMAAVGRLAIIATLAAGAGNISRMLTGVPRLLRRACNLFDTNRQRWCILVGLLLLLYTVWSNIQSIVSIGSRQGLAGDVPLFNFPGPKIMASRVTAAVINQPSGYTSSAGDYIYFWPAVAELLTPALLNLLGVWLITCSGEERAGARWRIATRWVATAAVAGPIGFVLSHVWENRVSPSRVTAWVSFLCEAPATCLLYLYLARLASPRIGARLRRFAIIAPALILAPLSAFAISTALMAWSWSLLVGVICAAFVAISMAATLLASAAIVSLAWEFARPMLVDSPVAQTAATSGESR